MPVRVKINKKKLSAFTLLELLLSISILAIISAIGITVNVVALNSSERLAAEQTVKQTIRTAQLRAQGMSNDSRWGVRINANQIVLFSGGSYASRNTSLDETFAIPARVSITGINEIVFIKSTGETTDTGNINISTSEGTNSITVNQYGVLDLL